MRSLPLNLHDTYGHIRMAIYAAGMDVDVESAPRLPDGMMGCYCERTHVILIDRRLPYVAKRCTLVHELVHWAHGDSRCGEHERRTRMETARRLIDPAEYATAEITYEADPWLMAEDLDVTVQVVKDYRMWLRGHMPVS